MKNGNSVDASVTDITENPKNLQFVELDAAQIPRSLDDTDLACVNTNYAIPAGLNPQKDSILVESKDSPYANVMALRQGDENNETYKKSWQSISLNRSRNSLKNTSREPSCRRFSSE
mgnify:CR=1 FL=1